MAQKPKPPKPEPQIGDRVRKRGFPHEGYVIQHHSTLTDCIRVWWDEGRGPNRAKWNHKFEVEIIKDNMFEKI